jgi:hypothetical protein
VEFRVRLAGTTIKALEGVLQQGFRERDVRVIRRVQVLLEVGAGRSMPAVADRLAACLPGGRAGNAALRARPRPPQQVDSQPAAVVHGN